jgi:hypothetical protein
MPELGTRLPILAAGVIAAERCEMVALALLPQRHMRLDGLLINHPSQNLGGQQKRLFMAP